MKKNNIKELKLLAETKFLSLYDAEYENKKGKSRHWIIASRKDYSTLKKQYFEQGEEKTDAVVIAAYHEKKDALVLIKQFRVPLNDYIYELPAGLIDGGENLENALVRELREETGLEVVKINETLGRNRTYLSAGMTEESAAIIYCICDGIVTKEYLEEDEDIEVFLVTQEKAQELLKSEVRMDAKVVILLQGFMKFGKAIFE